MKILSYISVDSASIHAFLGFFLPVLRTTLFPSHWLLFHMTLFETGGWFFWHAKTLPTKQGIHTSGSAYTELLDTFCMCINPFPNKPLFSHVCSASLLKTLWEKQKLLITSNFCFYYSVFYLSGRLSAIVIKFEIVVWKHFKFGRV